jgi:modulator of FtsH protease
MSFTILIGGSFACLILGIVSQSILVRLPAVLLFTVIEGALLSLTVAHSLNRPNGAEIILFAVAGTVLLTVCLSVFAMLTTFDTGFLKWYLFAALIMIIVMSVLNVLFFKLAILDTIISLVAIFLFSVYVMFDVQETAKGNMDIINGSLNVYLDMLNLFVNLLSLLGGSSDD